MVKKNLLLDYCTSISNGYDFIQNLLFSPAPHGLYYNIIGSSRCQSNQCSTVGRARKTHLKGEEEKLISGPYIFNDKYLCVTISMYTWKPLSSRCVIGLQDTSYSDVWGMGCQEMVVTVCASWGNSVSFSGKPNARPGRGPSLTCSIKHGNNMRSLMINAHSYFDYQKTDSRCFNNPPLASSSIFLNKKKNMLNAD